MFSFYMPPKLKRPSGFSIFYEGVKRQYWPGMGEPSLAKGPF